jgi:hypothetical protein
MKMVVFKHKLGHRSFLLQSCRCSTHLA